MNKRRANSRFIVAIEGIDRAGKTTQTELLRVALTEAGHPVRVVSFPRYESFFGRTIRRLLDGHGAVSAATLDPYSMSLWYALDRWEAFADAADWDGFVLLNRYTLSNAVYQSARAESAVEGDALFEWVIELEHGRLGLPTADLTVVLDVAPAVSQHRSHGRHAAVGAAVREEAPDVYERADGLLRAARARYLGAPSRLDDVVVVSCDAPGGGLATPQQVHERVLTELRDRHRF